MFEKHSGCVMAPNSITVAGAASELIYNRTDFPFHLDHRKVGKAPETVAPLYSRQE
jgi:hypothetical protein